VVSLAEVSGRGGSVIEAYPSGKILGEVPRRQHCCDDPLVLVQYSGMSFRAAGVVDLHWVPAR
jgi:hypothetical protein